MGGGSKYYSNSLTRGSLFRRVKILYDTGIQFYVLLSPCLCFISFFNLDLYVVGDNA